MKPLRASVLSTLLLAACLAMAQETRLHHDPAPARSAGPHKSFVDSSLGLLNARNIDYGLRIEEMRQSALDATVRNYNFWADAMAVGVLGVIFIYIYWQSRQNQSVRFSTARILVGYENELVVVRDRFAKLSAEYNQLRRTTDGQMEGTIAPKPQAMKRENATPGNGNNMEKIPAGGNGQTAVALQVRGEDGGLNAQLVAANDTIGSLRRQVSALTKRLEEEQQKNRKLRGE
jgi:hypothetical protein